MKQRNPFPTWRPREAWGVRLRGADGSAMLLGDRWHDNVVRNQRFDGELSRPLLFEARSQARAWCAAKNAKYNTRDSIGGAWRFSVVRVRESWQVQR